MRGQTRKIAHALLAAALGLLAWSPAAHAQCPTLESVAPIGSGSLLPWDWDALLWDVLAPEVTRVTQKLKNGRTVTVVLRNIRKGPYADYSFASLDSNVVGINDKIWVESSRNCGRQWSLPCFSSSGFYSKPVPNAGFTTRGAFYAADTGEYVYTPYYSEFSNGEHYTCDPRPPSEPPPSQPPGSGPPGPLEGAIGTPLGDLIAEVFGGVQRPPPAQGSSQPQPPPTADGTLLREPDGTIAVLAGGAGFSFANMAELENAGYGGKKWFSVPAGFLARLPKVPSDRTLLRDRATGSIVIIAGGAQLPFSTWDEYVAAGYERATFTNVAPRHIASFGSVPRDGTLLRDAASGTIAVIAGGAYFTFASWDEYVRAGYERAAFTNVPLRAIQALNRVPADGTLLHDTVTGTIAVIAGNAKFAFASWDEYVATGYERASFTTVPLRVIQAFSDVPLDGTLLRDRASGTIVSVVAGTKYAFRSWDEYVAAGYANATFTNVPVRFIDAIPDRAAL